MALSRGSIEALAAKPRLHEYHVPDWADETGDDLVYLRGLTGDEADEWNERTTAEGEDATAPSSRGVLAWLVRVGLVDPAGAQLFPSETDGKVVNALPFKDLNEIGMKILSLSGMTPEARAAIEGNSEAGQTGEQGSDSPGSTTAAPTTSS